MEQEFGVSIMLAISLIIIGCMFLSGIWGSRRRIKWIGGDIDSHFFSKTTNPKVILLADRLTANICFLMAMFTIVNGLMTEFFKFPNISMIFLVAGTIFTWPIKIIFVKFYKNKSLEKLPEIWPYG